MEYSTKNFSAKEFRCKCDVCNRSKPHKMEKKVVDNLQKMRDKLGPLVLTSAYRCAKHPVEAKKSTPGQHNKGTAVDIRFDSSNHRYLIIKEALALGATGIGWGNGFIHVDWRTGTPVAWDY
ncbi:MAG: YcbK family protein [Bacilli bacterium]